MARLPEPKTAAFRELARQLRFQPAEASRRQLDRAEELALQLITEQDAARSWPVEWVVFRITGYRTEQAAKAFEGTIDGASLQRDLASFIHVLSAAAGDREDVLLEAEPSRWLTLDQLCVRWSVSRQTIERYRALGLYSRRVKVARTPGKREPPHRTLFDRRAVEAFERAHGDVLSAAKGFSRIDNTFGAKLHRRAARYHERLGWSLSRIAAHLGKRFGRSAGAVRRAVLDVDQSLPEPCFGVRPTLGVKGRAEIVKTFRRGGRAKELAPATVRTRASVYRMVIAERAKHLRMLDLSGPARADFADERAAAKLLADRNVTGGLGRPPPHSVPELVEQAAETEPAAARERALSAAYLLLRFQAAGEISRLGRSPKVLGEGGIDWIETRLRWASRLKAELVRSQLGLMLRVIESHFEKPLTSFAGAIAAELVHALSLALFEAIDRHDPFKGGRLAAPAGLALNRAAARWLELHPPEAGAHAGRAATRGAAPNVRLDHVWRQLAPWVDWLEPPTGVRERIDTVRGRGREVLIARLGWDTRPPRTAEQTAAELSMPVQSVLRTERIAMRQLQ